MTKALEAAADAMWANMANSAVVVSPRLDPVIAALRAFAANVTEEMAEQCNGEVATFAGPHGDGCDHYWEASPAQIRAAILEGLK